MNRGIGKQLYKKFIEIAQEEGVRRAEWVALDWNINAIKFFLNLKNSKKISNRDKIKNILFNKINKKNLSVLL